MLIEINTDGNYASIIEEIEGRKVETPITINKLISTLVNSMSFSRINVINGLLHKIVKNVQVIQSKYIDTDNAIHILAVDKVQAYTILKNENIGEIGYPKLLFAVYVMNNRVTSLKIVAVKDKEIVEDTQLYEYPYTNVSGKQGCVCLGGNKFDGDVYKNDYLYKVPMLFYSMPNSFHSFSPAKNKGGYDCKELMLLMKDKEFNDSLLVEKENYKYSEWFSSL